MNNIPKEASSPENTTSAERLQSRVFRTLNTSTDPKAGQIKDLRKRFETWMQSTHHLTPK